VPKGQVVVNVEGEEGGSGGEEEGRGRERVAEKASEGRTWRTCGVGGWVYRAKYECVLKNHKANIHNIDIVWHDCPELGCENKAKQKGDVKRHRAGVHGIEVTWHECPEHNCSHKSKREGDTETQSRRA